MKEKWKRLWQRRPRLSRKWRVARNLTFAAAVAASLPFWMGNPFLSADAAISAMEQAYLLTPSQNVLEVRRGDNVGFIREGEGWVSVGQVYKIGVNARLFREWSGIYHQVLDKNALVVAALPVEVGDGDTLVAVTGFPETAEEGTLWLQIETEVFTARAVRDKERPEWMFFLLEEHDSDMHASCAMGRRWMDMVFWDGLGELPYTLVFKDDTGGEVFRRQGTLSPSQKIFYGDF